MQPGQLPGLRIAEVERLTGVGAHTLRAWERRYGVPTPDRTGGRQRMYSVADVETIRRMLQFSRRGVPLARAAEIARSLPVPSIQTDDSVAGAVPRLATALLHWDEAAAAAIWAEALETMDLLSAFERLVVPLMKEIGDGWHSGTVSVAQEHFASHFIRARIDHLSRQVLPLPGAPSVLLACVAGEHHEIGLLMLAAMLRFQGFRTLYLGQDVPSEDLVRTVEDAQPEVVALNAGSPSGAAEVARLATRIASAAPLASVVFGGPAFDGQSDRHPARGAVYGGPDLRAAVIQITQLGRRASSGGKR